MVNNFFKKLIENKIIIIVIVISFFAPYKINAATLSISPNSTTVSVGKTVAVKVYVNTEGKSINNGEAAIQFPVDMLDVVSITKSSSIFTLWVEEPVFSNVTGKISFNGGVPNPGFTGQSGYIVTITFKAKKQGIASVIFSDGAVRENDGLGTDILVGKSGSSINIKTAIKQKPKEEVKISPPPVIEKVIPVVIEFDPTIRFDGNQGLIKLSNEENISNTDYYTISIDDAPSFRIEKKQLINHEYYLPILNEGIHSLVIMTFDKTGKYTESVLSFMNPFISIPVLSLDKNEIPAGDSVVISGTTGYPNSKVNAILEIDNKEIKRYEQTTGIDGSFSITTDKIENIGVVNIWAENVLSDTVKSRASGKVYLKVNDVQILKINMSIFYPILWLILIFIIILLFSLLLYFVWHNYSVGERSHKIEQDK
jgi:hypothetical protein